MTGLEQLQWTASGGTVEILGADLHRQYGLYIPGPDPGIQTKPNVSSGEAKMSWGDTLQAITQSAAQGAIEIAKIKAQPEIGNGLYPVGVMPNLNQSFFGNMPTWAVAGGGVLLLMLVAGGLYLIVK